MMAERLKAYIGIRMTPDTKRIFEERAKQEGRSVSNWALRKLLTTILPSHDNPRQPKRA